MLRGRPCRPRGAPTTEDLLYQMIIHGVTAASTVDMYARDESYLYHPSRAADKKSTILQSRRVKPLLPPPMSLRIPQVALRYLCMHQGSKGLLALYRPLLGD